MSIWMILRWDIEDGREGKETGILAENDKRRSSDKEVGLRYFSYNLKADSSYLFAGKVSYPFLAKLAKRSSETGFRRPFFFLAIHV
jgi:hypothetical protein